MASGVNLESFLSSSPKKFLPSTWRFDLTGMFNIASMVTTVIAGQVKPTRTTVEQPMDSGNSPVSRLEVK